MDRARASLSQTAARWLVVAVVTLCLAFAGTSASARATPDAGLGGCASSTYPTTWPAGAPTALVWGQNWDVATLPANWYPFSGFYPGASGSYAPGDTADRLPSELAYPGPYLQLDNAVGSVTPGYIDDAGVGTLSSLDSGPANGTVFYAWCARFNDSAAFDTVAEVQEDGNTWPPEVALVGSPGKDGVVGHVSVHVYWTTPDGDYADGTSCGGDCNVHGIASWASPVESWDEFAVSWSAGAVRVYERFGQAFVLEAVVTDASCGAAADGRGYTEPCVPDGSNFQWTFQQNSLDGVTTVDDSTEPTDLAWVANYASAPTSTARRQPPSVGHR